MKAKGLFLAAFMAFLFVGTQSALAQRTATMDLTVTANNLGIFACSISSPVSGTFDFGDVDADGTTSSTGIAGVRRTPSNDGADYTATSAASWSCRAAPAETDVDISLGSGSHTGGMGADNLTIQIPATGGGSSQGYKAFSSLDDLITGMQVGNGGAAVSGTIDLNLAVMDTDPTGANTWDVVFSVRANP